MDRYASYPDPKENKAFIRLFRESLGTLSDRREDRKIALRLLEPARWFQAGVPAWKMRIDEESIGATE
jgi:hypothetical protein